MSSVSKDENLALSSEDSSSPDESELELGLGLSLSHPTKSHQYHHHHHNHNQNGSSYARIFTAKDFSSSPSSVGIGTKRPADSLDATNRPRFITIFILFYFLFSFFVYFVLLGYYVT
jgi:auxin-responsive protein IAA